jgi:hypothetical protein
MVDLETLGTMPGSVIVSLGALEFMPAGSSFYALIDATSCQQLGLRIEAGTVMWWLGQNEAARQALIETPGEPITGVLGAFADWMAAVRGGGDLRLWAKGPSFDASLLRSAYRAARMEAPWHYAEERCVRTVLELAGVERAADGVQHHALDDARRQAVAVEAAMARMAVGTPTEERI